MKAITFKSEAVSVTLLEDGQFSPSTSRGGKNRLPVLLKSGVREVPFGGFKLFSHRLENTQYCKVIGVDSFQESVTSIQRPIFLSSATAWVAEYHQGKVFLLLKDNAPLVISVPIGTN
ncbi:TPA: hypothetical protein I7682_17855 [Vibrio vulnificus]|nr:hypothetical protein [Vibrio vulnificus]